MNRDVESLEKIVEGALNTPEEPDWTPNGLDFFARYLFMRLADEVVGMTEFSPDFDFDLEHFCEAALSSYSSGWRFFILQADDKRQFELDSIPLAAKRSKLTTFPKDQFLSRLESLIYSLRVRENLLGLFPAFDRLRTQVWERSPDLGVPIFWCIDEQEVDDAVARRQTDRLPPWGITHGGYQAAAERICTCLSGDFGAESAGIR